MWVSIGIVRRYGGQKRIWEDETRKAVLARANSLFEKGYSVA